MSEQEIPPQDFYYGDLFIRVTRYTGQFFDQYITQVYFPDENKVYETVYQRDSWRDNPDVFFVAAYTALQHLYIALMAPQFYLELSQDADRTALEQGEEPTHWKKAKQTLDILRKPENADAVFYATELIRADYVDLKGKHPTAFFTEHTMDRLSRGEGYRHKGKEWVPLRRKRETR